MRKFFDKAEERGTLLVEAIAMLGLIAMVTPTLYKKSAERLQEIQDINAASQVRIMNNVVETFVRNNFQTLMDATSSDTDRTVQLAEEDNTPGMFDKGYSSFLPFGYTPNELRNYGEPQVYVHRDESRLITYVVFPHIMDPGKKRASRLASLVGANGGVITENKEAQGTGGSWFLDSSMVSDIEIDEAVLTENSLIVTSSEPIENSMEDNDKYLYRVPPEEPSGAFHNSMVTDLYMGGHQEEEGASKTQWQDNARKMHGIFNVRKLTLNTDCNYSRNTGASSLYTATCDPRIADLYIGKPKVQYSDKYSATVENEGAAWIWGNLSALNEGFMLGGNASSYSEMRLRASTESSQANYDIIYAKGEMDSSQVQVNMVGKFVSATKNGDAYQFRIAESMDGDEINDMFNASISSGIHTVRIGRKADDNVHIGESGALVTINSGGSTVASKAKTIINNKGGQLYAGSDEGAWLMGAGTDASARVEIMNSGGNYFAVGAGSGSSNVLALNDTLAKNAKIFVDFGTTTGANSSEVSLYGRRVKVMGDERYTSTSVTGGFYGASGFSEGQVGLTAISTHYTDIFGSVYLGNDAISSSDTSGAIYSRGGYTLGVAGNAWFDKMLWARNAWFNDAGFRNLHAGFNNINDYSSSAKVTTGWLNVYAPGTSPQLGNGRVVIRDPSKAIAGTYATRQDMMFMASTGVVAMSDTEGAWLQLDHGVAQFGTDDNYFLAEKADSSGVKGSSYVVGSVGVNIFTKDASISSTVDLQKGAMELYGQAGDDGNFDNTILARTGDYAIMLGSSAAGGIEDAQVYADESRLRTRYIDFEVERDSTGDMSSRVFGVYPDVNVNGSANVEINGSFHITGNEVVHIASDEYNKAEDDASRAMFEVDPDAVRVWAKNRVTGNYGNGGTDYYAMLTINPEDVSGESTAVGVMDETSVYVRKGAIELEKSYASGGSVSTYGADQGFGYIKANRLVSNTGLKPEIEASPSSGYDQYMVNPAYTSVMHDIKLTTRGGARLSDVLPDFVLKGVYNVSNDFTEKNGGKSERIGWSAGSHWSGARNPNDVAWASPYVGLIPYAMCPPGYKNMATMMPLSFQIGRVGRMIEATSNGNVTPGGKWQLAAPDRQSQILRKALENRFNGGILYPAMQSSDSLNWNAIFQSANTFNDFKATAEFKTEGWFLGVKTERDRFGYDASEYRSADVGDEFTNSENKSFVLAEPLYFQEGTFLKTALEPQGTASGKGWEGRIGFLYNADHYSGLGGAGSEGIVSNNTDGDDNADAVVQMRGSWVWNVFPVPTNSLEGHATVYCYFDRKEFDAQHVLQIDPLSDSYRFKDKNSGTSSDAYLKRLDDPTLKYSDPW